jgi:hypothetical protein
MRALVENKFSDNKKYVELYGTSSDSKPTTGIVTGSVFVEVDTGKCYLFNEDASAWVEVGA